MVQFFLKRCVILLLLMVGSISLFSQSLPRIRFIQIQQSESEGLLLVSDNDKNISYSDSLIYKGGKFMINGWVDITDSLKVNNVKITGIVDSTRLNADGDSLLYYQNGLLIGGDAILSTILSDSVTIYGDGTLNNRLYVDTSIIVTIKALNDSLSNYVTTNTTQSISGAKTFTSDLDIDAKIELNAGDDNIVIGDGAGANLVSGQAIKNILIGTLNGAIIDSGDYNIAIGHQSLRFNKTGSYNIANGGLSLYANETGNGNIANGFYALHNNLSGSYNIGNAYESLYHNTSGNYNIGSGFRALYSLNSGSDNQAYGYAAARYYGSGSDALTTANGSLFFGSNTRASANSNSNEIVIGTNAIGNGNNSVTIGNDGTIGTATTKTILNGNVGIGTSSPNKNLTTLWNSSDATVTTGNGLAGGAAGNGVLLYNTNTSANTYANLDFRANNADARIAYVYTGTINKGDFHFITDNTDSPISAMVIKNDGNVGIGTTAPTFKFNVVTDAVAGKQNLNSIDRTAQNFVTFTNPQYSADASVGLLLRVFPQSDSRQGAGIIASGGNNNATTDLDLFVTTSPDGIGGTSYSALKINGLNGNVGIGTTSPDGKLDIAQDMTDGSSSAFTTPHLALTATNTTDGTGFVGMTFATSNDANYGFSYGALRSGGGYGDIIWRYHFNSAQGTELMRLTNSGNLGLGVTPSAWSTGTGKAIEVSSLGNSLFGLGNGDIMLGSNFYYNNGFKYASANYATGYRQQDGVHKWYSAPSSTANNTITFTQAMTLDANGRLGIGTTSPDANSKLHVEGASGAINGTGMTYLNNTDDAFSLVVNNAGNSSQNDRGVFEARVGGSSVFRINNSGNVGIGTTTNPYNIASLVVSHNATLTRTYFQRGVNLIEIAPSDGTGSNLISSSYTFYGSAYKPLSLSGRQNAADLYLATSGNVGIGTTSPSASAKLHVNGTTKTTSADIGTTAGDIFISNLNRLSFTGAPTIEGQSSTKPLLIGTVDAQSLILYTNASERMRITSSGNVGIGTTSSLSNKLTVNGDTRIDGTLNLNAAKVANNFILNAYYNGASSMVNQFEHGSNQAVSFGFYNSQGTNIRDSGGAFTLNADGTFVIQHRVVGIGDVSVIKFDNSNNVLMPEVYGTSTTGTKTVYINSDGQLVANSSSIKTKDILGNYDKGIEWIKKLNPIYYTYKKDDRKLIQAGFIAEEFDLLGLNEFVGYSLNGDADGINYGQLSTLTVKAIQEQQAIIETQEQKITNLETENQNLNTLIQTLITRIEALENK